MVTYTKKITKEQYERATQNSGYISDVDMSSVFSPAELWGYGVYGNTVFEKDNQFYVRYNCGETCD